jgi:hypothetical protein
LTPCAPCAPYAPRPTHMLHVLGVAWHRAAWLGIAQLPCSEFSAEKREFSPNGVAASKLHSCLWRKHCQVFNCGPPTLDIYWMYVYVQYVFIYLCTYVYIYVCTYIYIYVCVSIYTIYK